MKVEVATPFLLDSLRLEADSRGDARRLVELTALREEDGMDGVEAELEAAETLGLTSRLIERLSGVALALEAFELPLLTVDGSHGGMPTLRRDGDRFHFTTEPATADLLGDTLARLVERFAFDPETTVAQLVVGLGGTGGCAAGDCLPEDAPAGPLFEARER